MCERGNTISSHKFFRYVLSVSPILSTFAARGCCRAFGSSTMVDPFILRAGWGSCRCPLSLMSSWSCTLVSARLFPLQLITKWSHTFIICRCCTQCSTDKQNSTSHHRSQLCWLLPTLLLFGWHHKRAFSSGDCRELRLKYLSPSITNAILPFIPHPRRVEESPSSVPMLLASSSPAVPLIFQWRSRRIHEQYEVATSSSSVVSKRNSAFSFGSHCVGCCRASHCSFGAPVFFGTFCTVAA